MNITLTRHDFSGEYMSSTRCALAKALKNKVDPNNRLNIPVLVGESSVTIGEKNYRLSVDQNLAIRREYLYPAELRGPLTITLH